MMSNDVLHSFAAKVWNDTEQKNVLEYLNNKKFSTLDAAWQVIKPVEIPSLMRMIYLELKPADKAAFKEQNGGVVP